MHSHIWIIPALICTFVGMTWFALSIKTHWRQLFANDLLQSRSLTMRALAGLMLLIAFGFCLLADHPSMAVLVWAMQLTAASLLVAFLLSCFPVPIKLMGNPFATRKASR